MIAPNAAHFPAAQSPAALFGQQAPVMVPYFVPGVGYVLGQAPTSAPVAQPNPFGAPQWNIPQLSGALEEQLAPKTAAAASSRPPPKPSRWPTTKEEHLDRFFAEVFPRLGNKGLLKLQKVACV